MSQLLEVEHLIMEFGGLRAVDDLSFAVGSGEILGFIGPNGAGKSTTFNCITGFHEPTDGVVRYDGSDITCIATHAVVNAGIARTFQTFKPLEGWTVLQHVVLGLLPDQFLSLESKQDHVQVRAAEICQRVGLGEDVEKTPDELAHAGLIRLEIAKALATEPDLLLVDEVFAGLATNEVDELVVLLQDLREDGITLIVIDHNMRGLFDLIDRCLVIQFGSKIAEGTPAEIKQNDRVRDAYLGS